MSCGELNRSALLHAKQQTGRTCCTAQHSTWEETVKRCINSYVSRHVTPLANSPALRPVAQVTHTPSPSHSCTHTLHLPSGGGVEGLMEPRLLAILGAVTCDPAYGGI